MGVQLIGSNDTFTQEKLYNYYTVICSDNTDGILQILRDFDHRDIIPWRLFKSHVTDLIECCR